MPILRLKHLRKTLAAVIFRFQAPSCRKISAFLQNCNIFLDYPTVFQYNKAYVRHGDDRYWFYRCDTCRTLKKLLWIFRENREPCVAAGKMYPDWTENGGFRRVFPGLYDKKRNYNPRPIADGEFVDLQPAFYKWQDIFGGFYERKQRKARLSSRLYSAECRMCHRLR